MKALRGQSSGYEGKNKCGYKKDKQDVIGNDYNLPLRYSTKRQAGQAENVIGIGVG